MNTQLKLSVSPHIHSGRSTRGIMLDVLIALLPVTAAGAAIFGLRSLLVVAFTVAACVGFEALFNLVAKKPIPVKDLSAAVTGLLLGLNLPANIPLWQCAVGALFAIVVVKGLFGGLGANPVNPAITARVFMLVSFGSLGNSPLPLDQQTVDTVTGATPLASEEATSLLDLLLGLHGGAIGETCALALLIGFAYLVIRKVIKWYVPAAYVATTFLCYIVFTGNFTLALSHVLAGGLLLGAIFMATDYVTTPVTNKGRVVFCIGCGILTFVIRQFGDYPEGVSLAILLMNLVTPYISALTKKKTLGGVK